MSLSVRGLENNVVTATDEYGKNRKDRKTKIFSQDTIQG
jgi:hypothetical protein